MNNVDKIKARLELAKEARKKVDQTLLSLRASPEFASWFSAEKKRKRMNARELCNLLALTYIVQQKDGKVAKWPMGGSK